MRQLNMSSFAYISRTESEAGSNFMFDFVDILELKVLWMSYLSLHKSENTVNSQVNDIWTNLQKIDMNKTVKFGVWSRDFWLKLIASMTCIVIKDANR